MRNGYDLFFDTQYGLVTFPITPAELSIKVGSNNEVVNLINEGDVNILKSPSLVDVEFEARFPMRKYPYSRTPMPLEFYTDIFAKLKTEKKSFRFIVARSTPSGKRTWDTNMLVSLEEFEIAESADEGDDVLINFKLKQYKTYGVKTIKLPQSNPPTTSTANKARDTGGKGTESSVYTVKSGDCLWNIAKAAYGKGSEYKKIYEANKDIIESTAKKHGKKSSSNGHWIYPNTKLVIPNISDASSLKVKKLW